MPRVPKLKRQRQLVISEARKKLATQRLQAALKKDDVNLVEDIPDTIAINKDSTESESEQEGEMILADNGFAELMKNSKSIQLSSHHDASTQFKYHRGSIPSRQIQWRAKGKVYEWKMAAAECSTLTSLFSQQTSKAPTEISLPLPIPPTKEELRGIILEDAIIDLEELMKSKSKRPQGQDEVRYLAVLNFLYLQRREPWQTRERLSELASTVVNRGCEVARRIREWEIGWIENRHIPPGHRGKNSRLASWLDDEGVELAVRNYISEQGDKLTSYGLARAVAEYLGKGEGDAEDIVGEALEPTFSSDPVTSVSDENSEDYAEDGTGDIPSRVLRRGIRARTARLWLNRLGFSWRDAKKGVYIDGHDRPDVISYRNDIFLPTLFALLPTIREWDEDGNVFVKRPLPAGEHEKVYVTHDESSFNANDGKRQMWIQDGHQPLRQKSKGKGIMVSEFLTPRGRLQLPAGITLPGLGTRRYATEYLKYRKDNY